MKTIFDLIAADEAFEAKARKTTLRHLEKRELREPKIKSFAIEEEMSGDMARTYYFIFSYADEDGRWETTGHLTYFANGTHMIQLELDENDPAAQAPDWKVLYDDYGGAMIYTMRQDGWRKGEAVMINDVMVRVEPQNKSTTDITPVVDRIVAALEA